MRPKPNMHAAVVAERNALARTLLASLARGNHDAVAHPRIYVDAAITLADTLLVQLSQRPPPRGLEDDE